MSAQPIWHVCLSGSLGCSGLSPCEPCHAFVMQNILPRGEAAAGLNGGILAFVYDVMKALADRGVHLSQLGIEVPGMFETPAAQSAAFEQGCADGWREFHQAIGDPAVRQQLGIRLTDVRQLMAVASAQVAAAASEASSRHPVTPSSLAEGDQSPPEAPSPPPKQSDPAVLEKEREQARALAKPMDAEEIAAAGIPISEDMLPSLVSRNGVGS